MPLRHTICILLLMSLSACVTPPQPVEGLQAFSGARIIDGTGGTALENGVLIVQNGRIEAVGSAQTIEVPPGAQSIDVTGKTIMPGLINAHGHVGGTKGLETDHFTEENLLRQLRLYARYGITTINSLGGDTEKSILLRNQQNTPDLNRSRLFVAGTIVTGETPEEARKQVDENAANKVDFIKIRIDDNLGRGKKMSSDVYRAVIDQAHRHNLPVAAHLVDLEDARDLAEAGVDLIAHSIRDKIVDDELIALLKEKNIPYCPTLMREVSVFTYEDVPGFFSDPFFLKEADPSVLEQLKDPKRQDRIQKSQSAQWYKKQLETAKSNLKKLSDGGVLIAMGTDTGPPGRFQGYFEHEEMKIMAQTGLTPMQIILSATRDAAKTIKQDNIGTLVPGKWADFIILSDNPLTDIAHLRSIESVWIAGNKVPDK